MNSKEFDVSMVEKYIDILPLKQEIENMNESIEKKEYSVNEIKNYGSLCVQWFYLFKDWPIEMIHERFQLCNFSLIFDESMKYFDKQLSVLTKAHSNVVNSKKFETIWQLCKMTGEYINSKKQTQNAV